MRKLTKSETFVVSMFVSLILVLSFVYGVVALGWLGGAAIGETDPSDLLVQMIIAMIMIFLPAHLIMKYAGEGNISNKPFLFLK